MTAPDRIWAFCAPEIAEIENGATIVAHETVQHGGAEYIRADLVPDPAAIVRAALEAAAGHADYTGAIQDQRDGSYAGSVAVMGRDVGDIIRAIASDPEAVAAIVAKAKGAGE
jgi:hypothetical protein